MAMFEVYRKKVTIDGNEYVLSPLSGKFLPKFFMVMKSFADASGGDELSAEESGRRAVSAIDPEAMGLLHELCLETFVKSYPNENRAALDEFVTQHLMDIVPVVIEVNSGTNVPK